ncbi:MAG TPA: hypothetical protein VF940_25060 [Streptosporangiaceae bacterium]
MRWPHENAITRRDEHLARTRRLSIWIAGGATAASVGLAAALGFALPGHAASSGATRSSGGGSGQNSGRATGSGGSSGSAGQHRKLAPPRQAPGNSAAPPVVSSGGS